MEDTLRLVPDLDHIICEALSEKFHVQCCQRGHFWFAPWENHRRMVFNLYALKGNAWPIYWGYNFDFIPWENCLLRVNPKSWNVTGKLVYHRTEKSVYLDYTGDVFPYIHYNFDRPDLHSPAEHLAIRNQYFVNPFGTDSQENREQIKAVVRRNIPYMLEWFEQFQTEDDIINALTLQINEHENEHCFPFAAYWVRGFLKAKQHDVDGAFFDIGHVYEKRFDPPSAIPQKVVQKIYEIDKLSL